MSDDAKRNTEGSGWSRFNRKLAEERRKQIGGPSPAPERVHEMNLTPAGELDRTLLAQNARHTVQSENEASTCGFRGGGQWRLTASLSPHDVCATHETSMPSAAAVSESTGGVSRSRWSLRKHR